MIGFRKQKQTEEPASAGEKEKDIRDRIEAIHAANEALFTQIGYQIYQLRDNPDTTTTVGNIMANIDHNNQTIIELEQQLRG